MSDINEFLGELYGKDFLGRSLEHRAAPIDTIKSSTRTVTKLNSKAQTYSTTLNGPYSSEKEARAAALKRAKDLFAIGDKFKNKIIVVKFQYEDKSGRGYSYPTRTISFVYRNGKVVEP